MLHRLILLGLLSLTFLTGVACRGDIHPVPILPVSNYVGINLSAAVVTLNPGETFEVRALALPFGLATPVDLTGFLRWDSTDPGIASVSGSGVVSANAPGSAIISASLVGDDGSELQSSTLFVAVTGTPSQPSTAVVLQALTIRMGDGSGITNTIQMTTDDSLKLSVIGHFSDGTTGAVGGITWRVSNPTVATITADGTLSPLKAGLISVNARQGSLESNYIVVQITEAPA